MSECSTDSTSDFSETDSDLTDDGTTSDDTIGAYSLSVRSKKILKYK
jgi:hypothetical protein